MKNTDRELLNGKLEYLKKVSLFSGLEEENIRVIIEKMTVEKIEAGVTFIQENSVGSDLYILLEGEVEISKSLVLPEWVQTTQKTEKSLIHLSEKHFPFFGEMAIYEEQSERSASITAIRPCLMALISKKNLWDVFEKDYKIGMIINRNVAAELVKRLNKANKDILKLTTAFTLALEG
ncbi:MAG: cyclic nucleotide-binding domain-containing protein [Calditrichaceae bacterium]|jgi:CRP/FNR family cyclic AMP-dependent transcriptional regulator